MRGASLAVVLERRNGNYGQPLLPSLKRHLDRSGVQPPVRKNQDGIARLKSIAQKNIPDVAFLALQPKQLASASWADHVEPHQAGIMDGKKSDEAAITGKDIEHRNDGVTAPEKVNSASIADGAGKDLARPFDLFFLRLPDGLDDFSDPGEIMFSRHSTLLIRLLKNSTHVAFRGAANGEESHQNGVFKAGFLAVLGMT